MVSFLLLRVCRSIPQARLVPVMIKSTPADVSTTAWMGSLASVVLMLMRSRTLVR
ncbi:MAG: hypothetical protein HC903_08525 [Methylacidiphilales bacterium]|nr:hypothetical protein [Candidatus Methylacidiphilales bacterium]NJR15743.1 hypothetical protein [Calothrix sp. CSU_2_0]